MTVPAELAALPQWLVWRWEVRGGKRTKIPVNPKTGANASSTDATTWGTLAQARAAAQDNRIGFVVTPSDPYCGVDIDHCYDPATKTLNPQAKKIADSLQSYTELTPSGEGIRVWVKASLANLDGHKKHLQDGVSIEIYDRGRYFTVTGKHGAVIEICERQAEIDALYAEIFPVRPPEARPVRGAALSLSDLALLSKAHAARNGDNFDRLWSGNTDAYAGDDSSADFALLCHLAFWTRCDAGQMDRLFRQSSLGQREKWVEREDYRLRSISEAIRLCGRVYDPGVPVTKETDDGVSYEHPGPPPVVDGLIEIGDLEIEIDDYYRNGLPQGEHPGWDSLAKLYRISRGEWTVVTGRPNSGKSEWLDALVWNLIKNLGWRFGIFSPENQPVVRHFAKLAEKANDAPWFGFDRMNEDELAYAKTVLGDHLVFLLPESPTIDAVLGVARAAIEKRGLDGLIIDPWNEIEHMRPEGLNETEYVSLALSRFRRFARQYQIHLWLVAHPAKQHKEPIYTEDGKRKIKDGRQVMEYPVPELYDISGSAKWNDKADNGIAIHRNFDGEKHMVEIHVHKIRFRQNGKPGVAFLRWQPRSGRFEDTGLAFERGNDGQNLATPPAERPRYADPPLSEELAEATTDSAETQQGDFWGPIGGEMSDDAIRAAMSPKYRED